MNYPHANPVLHLGHLVQVIRAQVCATTRELPDAFHKQASELLKALTGLHPNPFDYGAAKDSLLFMERMRTRKVQIKSLQREFLRRKVRLPGLLKEKSLEDVYGKEDLISRLGYFSSNLRLLGPRWFGVCPEFLVDEFFQR